MKIIIDLQGLQLEGNRKRGIGRYCLEITKALINYYPENEYTLFTNSALVDLRDDFYDELNNKRFNVIYFQCPTLGDLNNSYVGRYSNLWSSIQLRSYALSIINSDIILITSFFDGFRDNTVVSHEKSFKLPPIVSIIYDLIPLIHRDQYLNDDPEYKLFYLNKIKELSNLDALLAISQSSLKEASKYLEIKPEFIYNISSACNMKKFSAPLSNSNIDTKYLGRFLLYSGAIDPRKNLYRLIEAYASLPLNLIFKHKLVLTGPYTDEEILLINEWMITFGLPTEYVIFLGFVSDIELANLYRTCHLFIFPSLHEGFGLPVLEAMNCGAAVIAANVTSLPELIGDHKFLFDPNNAKDMSSLIYKSLTDDKFYQTICFNSRQKSKYFSWKNTAKRTIDSLKKVLYSKSTSLNKNQVDFNLLIHNQYNILINNFSKSPFLKSINNSKSDYLKSLASSISIINNQSKKIEFSRLAKNNEKLTWHIEGPFDSSYSLAILNRNYALAMDNLGQNVSLFCTEGPGDYQPKPEFLENNKMVDTLYQRGIKNKDRLFICTRNLYPPRVTDMQGIYNIFHSYGWEESEFPQAWVESFNNSLQGITVMSSSVKKILIDNGVNIPIKVTGLGLDHINLINVDNDFHIKAKKYKLLHVSSCFPRKGIDVLIEAYARAFTNNDDVSLIIKTFPNPHNNVEELLTHFKQINPSFPDVIIIYDDLTEEELKALFLQVDVLIAPSRGEGFGLPIGEAMSIGLPVITTGWGGQMDFCNEDNCWLIDYKFGSSRSHLKSIDSYWAEPSVEDLVKQISNIYHSSPTELRKKTDYAIKDIQSFTWENNVKGNIKFIEKELIHNNSYKHFKLGCISPINSKCGIASYTKYLLLNTEEDVVFFTPFNENDELNHFSNINIVPSWNNGNKDDDLTFLKKKIISLEITSLVIQFNYGFFDFSKLSILINDLKEHGVKIFIILHSTLDPENDKSKSLNNLLESFKKAERLLVHTINDLNRLKVTGLINNVSLFPHGFLDFKPASKNIFTSINTIFQKKSFNIATYGFCLPNKGYKELILACSTLIEKGFNIRLTILSAIYRDEYYWVFEQLNDLIIELDLKQSIFINTSYMNDEQTLRILSTQDCLVFPYQETGESSSASVRHGIASNKNVLVTPSPIFDDVSLLVNYLPGFSYLEIAQGLERWFSRFNDIKFKEEGLDSQREKILSERIFSKLSYRLISMIKSLELN